MNMIGKITGVDWSKAPEDATHRNRNYKLPFNHCREWYKDDDTEFGQVYWEKERCWVGMNCNRCECISKQEDLGMKQVKSIKDLEVGMFLKSKGSKPTIRVIMLVGEGVVKTTIINGHGDETATWTAADLERNNVHESWSYSYNGEYTSRNSQRESYQSRSRRNY